MINTKIFCRMQFKNMLFAAFLSGLMMIITDMPDMILAAKFFGDKAMAGVNLVAPLTLLSWFAGTMISTGTSYLYSFEIGTLRKKHANQLVGQAVILTAILSIIIAFLAFFGKDLIFSLFSEGGEVVTFAKEYYSGLAILFVISPASTLMMKIVYVDGGGKLCLIASVVEFFVNIIASVFLGLNYGISGLAFGTVIGYLAAVAVLCKWIFFDSQTLKPISYFSLPEIIKVFKYSYASAALYLHISLGNMILNAFFLRHFGEESFPILAVITGLLQFTTTLNEIGRAADPLVNVYLGEKNFDGVAKVMNIANKTAIIFGLALVPLFFYFSINIAEFFGITEAKFLPEAQSAIQIIAFSMPFLSILYLFTIYYQICGHLRLGVSISLCKDLIFYVSLPIISGLIFGVSGVWFGMMLVSIVSVVTFAVFLRKRYPKNFPLLLPKSDIVSRDEILTFEKVIELRNWGRKEFAKRGFSAQDIKIISLLIDEIGMSIVNNNIYDSPLVELTIIFDEQPRLIIRDNGRHFNLRNEKITSLRSFYISNILYMDSINLSYLIAQNYNRHVFTLIRCIHDKNIIH